MINSNTIVPNYNVKRIHPGRLYYMNTSNDIIRGLIDLLSNIIINNYSLSPAICHEFHFHNKLLPFVNEFRESLEPNFEEHENVWDYEGVEIIFTDNVPPTQIYFLMYAKKNKNDSRVIIGNIPADIDKYVAMKAFL